MLLAVALVSSGSGGGSGGSVGVGGAAGGCRGASGASGGAVTVASGGGGGACAARMASAGAQYRGGAQQWAAAYAPPPCRYPPPQPQPYTAAPTPYTPHQLTRERKLKPKAATSRRPRSVAGSRAGRGERDRRGSDLIAPADRLRDPAVRDFHSGVLLRLTNP
ncbi:hypothetical protein EVAR_103299_1 [Eumeta japonica]|uniref:Uncharacterized protein n=1 Tax=Eumeta variegata TaxID=151549 RepID=A0A4C1XTA4_EUMVA|nr:hypothetical protein EVAR_103299_1 [Eumeta japonica]